MKRTLRLSGKAQLTDGRVMLTFGGNPNDLQFVVTQEEAKEFADTVTTTTPVTKPGEVASSVTTHATILPSYQLVITEIKEAARPVPPPPVVRPPVPPPAVFPVAPVPPVPPAPPAPVVPKP